MAQSLPRAFFFVLADRRVGGLSVERLAQTVKSPAPRGLAGFQTSSPAPNVSAHLEGEFSFRLRSDLVNDAVIRGAAENSGAIEIACAIHYEA